MPLTDAQIKALKPAERIIKKFDGGGLFIEVAPSGRKTFRLNYRFAGKARTEAVGVYPDTKLADARIARERVKAALREGRDPAPKRAATEAARPRAKKADEAGLWRTLVADYLTFRRRDGAAKRTQDKLERQLNETLAILGDKHVQSITATDILDLVRPIEEKGKVETAHEVRTRCSQVFQFAEAHGFPNTNPAIVARGAMVKRKPGQFAGITDRDEIGALIRTIRADRKCEPQIRAALLLSAYLFPRNTELRGMLWSEIDWDKAMWEVPAERMKMPRDHLVPLPRQALAILNELKPLTGRYKLAIASPMDPTRMVSDNTFNAALRRMGVPSDKHVHHGFRTTASTSLNELGFNRDWIERQLAHVEGNKVRGTYNKAQYWPAP